VSRFHSYLNSASEILKQYNGKEPFSSFLKKFFSLQKKFGSRDRKEIAQLCYSYFRLGKDFPELETAERILTGLFLCATGPNEIISTLKPEWSEKISLPLFDKLNCLSPIRHTLSIFLWKNQLSEGINFSLFNQSFLVQPNLFLRVRPGFEHIVIEKLKHSGYSVLASRPSSRKEGSEPAAFPPEGEGGNQRWMRLIGDDCVELPNSSGIEEIIELDKEAVVQDYNSQFIAEYFEMVRPGRSDHFKIWDCCAGSGGKSILAKDVLGDIDLTVSDIRESILINLKKRFQKAGISNYKSMVKDLTAPDSRPAWPAGRLPPPAYDLILCDAPCTGSGTWSRTPEQLYFFEENVIDQYASLQKKIVSNAMPALAPGGYFLYITCSVFKKENEAIVEFIREKFHLTLVKMEILKGYDKKADTMFAALFTSSAA
jgi:16S rRNA (cytosine967-C5)-methyltransferase